MQLALSSIGTISRPPCQQFAMEVKLWNVWNICRQCWSLTVVMWGVFWCGPMSMVSCLSTSQPGSDLFPKVIPGVPVISPEYSHPNAKMWPSSLGHPYTSCSGSYWNVRYNISLPRLKHNIVIPGKVSFRSYLKTYWIILMPISAITGALS